jgi:Na+/H+ antiporter NhaC
MMCPTSAARDGAALGARSPLARILVAVLFFLGLGTALADESIGIDAPGVVLRDVPFDVTVTGLALSAGATLVAGESSFALAAGEDGTLVAEDVQLPDTGTTSLTAVVNGTSLATTSTKVLPGVVSILPPALAITTALVLRSVIPALFLGAWLGTIALGGLTLPSIWTGMLAVFQVHVRDAVANADHAAIMLFTFMIGGMVGIVSRNGGMMGVVNGIASWASTRQRGQVATAAMGVAIFFDDYANTLVVGNTMRPVTDALRISREKLAFLVDATAAPIACIALVTTWVGYEISLIGEATATLEGFEQAPYLLYLNSIAYSFYPLLMLVFVFLIAGTGRDFGAMASAEGRAAAAPAGTADSAETKDAQDPDLMPAHGIPLRAVNAVVPVAVLIAGVPISLYITGEGETLVDIIGSANSYTALMWSSLVAVLTAVALTVGQRLLSLEETMAAWYSGVRQMLFAMIILVLAWTLGSVTDSLHAADYLASLLGELLAPPLVPAIVFVLAAVTAFATGTSWGTMGILLPLVVPLVWAILGYNGIQDAAHMHILHSAIACVLCGAVWGDHCSPISDTTILASLASGCDHVDHVTTQLPYAALVGGVAVLLCTLPAGFGVPWWFVFPVSAGLLVLAVRSLGRQPAVATAVSGGG